MRINEITVGKKFNLGNYESLEIRISVTPEPDDIKKNWEAAAAEISKKLDAEIKKIREKL